MSLSTTQQNVLTRLHGSQYLIEVTNPETDSPTAIDLDVLETAVDMSLAWFNRRGYALLETDIEVLAAANLWARPRSLWGSKEREQIERLERNYPPAHSNIPVGTGVAPGDTDDRRSFGDDQLAALDKIAGSRQGKSYPRGPV